MSEQFAKMPRDLLESPAWQSLSIHARRFVDYLLVEHLRHRGRRNGHLLAPQRQLVDVAGIHAHHVGPAITEAELVGIVDCQRGTGRRASTYTLTWIPLSDGAAPSNRWRECAAAATLAMEARRKAKTRDRPSVATAKVQSQKVTKVQSQEMHALCSVNACQSAVTRPVKPPQSAVTTGGCKVHAPSRISTYQGNDLREKVDWKGEDVGAGRVEASREQHVEASPAVPSGMPAAVTMCRWPMGNGCDRPAIDGGRLCEVHRARR